MRPGRCPSAGVAALGRGVILLVLVVFFPALVMTVAGC